MSESVQVSAHAALLQTESMKRSEAIVGKQMENTPVNGNWGTMRQLTAHVAAIDTGARSSPYHRECKLWTDLRVRVYSREFGLWTARRRHGRIRRQADAKRLLLTRMVEEYRRRKP